MLVGENFLLIHKLLTFKISRVSLSTKAVSFQKIVIMNGLPYIHAKFCGRNTN